MVRPLEAVKAPNSLKSYFNEISAVHIVEVSSNVYFVKKHRGAAHSRYIDGREVAQELNNGFNLILERADGTFMTNFDVQPYIEFMTNKEHLINREL